MNFEVRSLRLGLNLSLNLVVSHTLDRMIRLVRSQPGISTVLYFDRKESTKQIERVWCSSILDNFHLPSLYKNSCSLEASVSLNLPPQPKLLFFEGFVLSSFLVRSLLRAADH